MAHRGYAARLFHDDDVLVEMADDDGLGLARPRRGPGQQLDRLAFLEPAGGVEAEFAVDLGVTRFDELANLLPGLAGQERAQDRRRGSCRRVRR